MYCPSAANEDSRSKEELFRDFTSLNGLSQLTPSPTHRGGNLIDLVFTNDEDLISEIIVSPAPIKTNRSMLCFVIYCESSAKVQPCAI